MTPPRSAGRGRATVVTFDEFGQHPPGFQPYWVVMIAGNDDGLGAALPDPPKELEHGTLGGAGGTTTVEHIACHQHQVDALALDEAGQAIEHGFELVEPVNTFPLAPGMPVTGMYNQHEASPLCARTGHARRSA